MNYRVISLALVMALAGIAGPSTAESTNTGKEEIAEFDFTKFDAFTKKTKGITSSMNSYERDFKDLKSDSRKYRFESMIERNRKLTDKITPIIHEMGVLRSEIRAANTINKTVLTEVKLKSGLIKDVTAVAQRKSKCRINCDKGVLTMELTDVPNKTRQQLGFSDDTELLLQQYLTKLRHSMDMFQAVLKRPNIQIRTKLSDTESKTENVGNSKIYHKTETVEVTLLNREPFTVTGRCEVFFVAKSEDLDRSVHDHKSTQFSLKPGSSSTFAVTSDPATMHKFKGGHKFGEQPDGHAVIVRDRFERAVAHYGSTDFLAARVKSWTPDDVPFTQPNL